MIPCLEALTYIYTDHSYIRECTGRSANECLCVYEKKDRDNTKRKDIHPPPTPIMAVIKLFLCSGSLDLLIVPTDQKGNYLMSKRYVCTDLKACTFISVSLHSYSHHTLCCLSLLQTMAYNAFTVTLHFRESSQQ